MTDGPRSKAILASSSIITARVFYAVNWFNVAAIFPLIAFEFEQDIGLLGSISAAFFLGVGLFQVPAGLFAARYSPRTSAIFGIALASAAALVYGFATEESQLVWLRFIVGAGMAFFFSSGIVLIARHVGERSSGFSIGMMNSAHSVGGIIGLFAWIIIAQMVGWRPSLVLSGAIGIATAIFMIMTIPRQRRTDDTGSQVQTRRWPSVSETVATLSNRPLIALGLVLTGVQASWSLLVTFVVVYLQSLNIPLESTGIIASLSLVAAVVSAPLIGRFYDRKVKDARKILFACGIGIIAALAAMSVPLLPVIIAAIVALGFFGGGAFTVAFAKARTTGTSQSESKEGISGNGALNVAWINGLSLVGILWMPLVFSLAVKSGGYSDAWLLSAILAALFVFVPLKKVGK